jgi:hypothetical protein
MLPGQDLVSALRGLRSTADESREDGPPTLLLLLHGDPVVTTTVTR